MVSAVQSNGVSLGSQSFLALPLPTRRFGSKAQRVFTEDASPGDGRLDPEASAFDDGRPSGDGHGRLLPEDAGTVTRSLEEIVTHLEGILDQIREQTRKMEEAVAESIRRQRE